MDLTISNLSKTYPNGTRALDNVSLDIRPGMFGLLGPNGAGKSTLMRILATLQEADSGEAKLGEIDVLIDKQNIKKVLGYLPQEFGFYEKETPLRLLNLFARLKGVAQKKDRKLVVEALLKRVNLWEVRKSKLGSFSGGMKQRFGIAQALLGNTKLIIVDEPTAGLDPEERNRFHNLLSEIGEDVVVLLSTHIVDDVSDLCRQMAIIQNGRILTTGSPQEATNRLQGWVWTAQIPKSEIEEYKSKFFVLSVKLSGGSTHIRILADQTPGKTFKASDPTLEDVYFQHLYSKL